jgi:membrane protein DedA with SNARE-associated domain
VNNLLDNLLNVPPAVAFTVIALLVFSEAALFVGFVLPGETAVFLGGVLAASGRVSLPVLLVVVVLAAVIGDSVGYEIGRKFGPRILASRPLQRHHERLTRAQTVLRTRGGPAVFVGRFTAFLRAVTPALTGASRMPYRRFLAYNAAGAIVWGIGVSMIGYSAGASFAHAQQQLGRFSAMFLAALIIAGVVYLLVRRRTRRQDGTSS